MIWLRSYKFQSDGCADVILLNVLHHVSVGHKFRHELRAPIITAKVIAEKFEDVWMLRFRPYFELPGKALSWVLVQRKIKLG